MRFKSFALSCAVTAFCIAGADAASAAPDARGVWLNDTGRGAIEIKDCGDKLCGYVVWTRDATDASRGCGKQMIGDVSTTGNGVWDGGWVYSPDKKKRFDVEIKPLSDGTLQVMGYAGTKFFSKTMIWTKAPADLQRCDATQVDANSAPPANTPAAPAASPQPPAVATAPAAEPQKPAESAKTAEPVKPAPESKPSESKEAAAPPAKDKAPQDAGKPTPRVAEADKDGDSGEDIIDQLDGKEFGDGYGLKKLPDGDCRVKLPYVTITVPCKK